MTLIPFPALIKTSPPEEQALSLCHTADLEEILIYLGAKKIAVILFIDQQDFCVKYAASPWVPTIAKTIRVDQETVEYFKIDKVPQWRWYHNGSDIHHLIGAASEADTREIDQLCAKQIGGQS